MSMRRAIIVILIWPLAGCTFIKIEGPAQVVQAHFGVLRIEPAPGARAVIYSSSGIGIVPGHNGVTLGVRHDTVALIYAPEDCRIILFQPNHTQIDTIVNALTAGSSAPQLICEVRGITDEKTTFVTAADRGAIGMRHY